MTKAPNPKKGCCRICHASVKLNKTTGKVRKHSNKYFKEPCAGSGKPPSAADKLKQGEDK